MATLIVYLLLFTGRCDSCNAPVSILLVRPEGLTCFECRFTDSDCEEN